MQAKNIEITGWVIKIPMPTIRHQGIINHQSYWTKSTSSLKAPQCDPAMLQEENACNTSSLKPSLKLQEQWNVSQEYVSKSLRPKLSGKT